MKPIHFTIELNPTTKKNSSRILINRTTGRPFIAPSEAYKKYARQAAVFIPLVDSEHNIIEPIEEPVNIKCLFYMGTKRKVDLTNLLEAIDDILER